MAEVHNLPGAASRAVVSKPPQRRRRPSQSWRWRHARDAASEVCAIASLLQREGPEIDPDLLRGLSIRLEALAVVILVAGDDVDDAAAEAEAAADLYGPEAARRSKRKPLGAA